MQRSSSYGSVGCKPVAHPAEISPSTLSHGKADAKQPLSDGSRAQNSAAGTQDEDCAYGCGICEDWSTFRSYVQTIVWSTAWVAANVFLTMYNKWGFQRSYSTPVFLTGVHCLACYLIALARSAVVKPTPNRARMSEVWKQCVLYALFNAIFLSCNNWAIMRLHPATVEVLKTFQPVVQVVIAIGVEGYMIDSSKLATLGLLTVFSIMTTYNPTHFDLEGFSMVFLALVAMALRQSYTGLIFKRGLKAWDTILYTQGISALFLLAPSLLLEFSKIESLLLGPESEMFVTWVVGGASTAVFYLFTSFALQRITDSIYMTIAGKIKNIVIIVVSAAVIHIHFESFQIVGMIGTLFSAAMYTYFTIEGAKRAKQPSLPAPATAAYDTAGRGNSNEGVVYVSYADSLQPREIREEDALKFIKESTMQTCCISAQIPDSRCGSDGQGLRGGASGGASGGENLASDVVRSDRCNS